MIKLILLIFLSIFAIAKGTIAGSVIENRATVKVKLQNSIVESQSNKDTFVVDQIVDIKLSWQDSSEVAVASGEKDRVLTFEVSNIGNKRDTVTLEHIDNGGNSFSKKPTNVRIYKDTNGNGVWDENDIKVSKVTLNEDSNTTLFLVSDIQEDNYNVNDKDDEGIKAISKSSNSSGNDNKDKIDTVVRNKNAQDYGTYIIRDYWLETLKSSKIESEDNKTHTGSVIEYKIELKIGGSNTNKEITDIKLKDAIPNGTTYINGSLKLNGTTLSDAKDGDAGYFENNTIWVSILKIKNSETKEVLFKVKVN